MSITTTTTTGVDNNVILLFFSPRRYGHEFRVLSEHLLLIGVATSISIVIIPPWYNDHCIYVIVGVTIVIVTIIGITTTNAT
jgi:hypothetical protein